jgi:hypothetical protein
VKLLRVTLDGIRRLVSIERALIVDDRRRSIAIVSTHLLVLELTIPISRSYRASSRTGSFHPIFFDEWQPMMVFKDVPPKIKLTAIKMAYVGSDASRTVTAANTKQKPAT